MMETEIQATAHYAMAKMGGEDPAIRTLVRVGRRRGAIHHVLPCSEKVRSGDLVVVDYCASYKRYHVDLARNFSLGEPDPRWNDVLRRAAGSIARVVEMVRPYVQGIQ
jgi:Xaa-Pro aminopeptidase